MVDNGGGARTARWQSYSSSYKGAVVGKGGKAELGARRPPDDLREACHASLSLRGGAALGTQRPPNSSLKV